MYSSSGLASIRALGLRKIFTAKAAVGARNGDGLPAQARTSSQRKQEIPALSGLSLDVSPGEIFCLLGPNGAGKSTTLGILTTRIRPTSGHAWVGEHDVAQKPVAVKRLIGVVGHHPNLDPALTAREILHVHASYFGMGPQQRNRRAEALLDRFGLRDRADFVVRGFSYGMLRRLAIARAMMHSPEVLFLDEPSSGLDPQTRLLLWDVIREYNSMGKTILLTTHNMEEADAMAHRIAIIDRGITIAIGTAAELKRAVPGGYLVRLRFRSDADDWLHKIKALAGVREVRAGRVGEGPPACADIYADRAGSLIPEIASLAISSCVELCDLHISEPSLENLFLHHTGRSLRE